MRQQGRADEQGNSIVKVGALTAFILLHVSVIGYYLVRQKTAVRGTWFAHGAIPVIGALLLLVVLASATHLALLVGLVWFAVGIIIAFASRRSSRS